MSRVEWSGSTCRSCKARIVWSTNVDSGKRMPLDAEPVSDGNIVVTSGNDGPEARVLKRAELEQRRLQLPHERLYKSHHATCPQASEWRR